MSAGTSSSGRITRALVRFCIVTALNLLLFVLMLPKWQSTVESRDRDFCGYYFAAVAQRAGANPYDVASVNRFNTTSVPITAAYSAHPYTLALFRLFTLVPYQEATLLWTGLQMGVWCLISVLLVLFELGTLASTTLFILIAFWGLGNVLMQSVSVGSMALLEALAVWTALVAFLADWLVFAVAALIIAGFFEPFSLILTLPAVYSLLTSNAARRGPRLAVLLVITLGVWSSPFVLAPRLFSNYLTAGVHLVDMTSANLALPTLLAQLLRPLISSLPATVTAAYCVFAAVVLLIYALVVRQLSWDQHRRGVLLLSFITYLLLCPTVEQYQYVQALPALYLISKRSGLLIGMALFAHLASGFEDMLPALLIHYQALLAVFIAWLVLVIELLRVANSSHGNLVIAPA